MHCVFRPRMYSNGSSLREELGVHTLLEEVEVHALITVWQCHMGVTCICFLGRAVSHTRQLQGLLPAPKGARAWPLGGYFCLQVTHSMEDSSKPTDNEEKSHLSQESKGDAYSAWAHNLWVACWAAKRPQSHWRECSILWLYPGSSSPTRGLGICQVPCGRGLHFLNFRMAQEREGGTADLATCQALWNHRMCLTSSGRVPSPVRSGRQGL